MIPERIIFVSRGITVFLINVFLNKIPLKFQPVLCQRLNKEALKCVVVTVTAYLTHVLSFRLTAVVSNLVCLKNSRSDGQLNASNYVTLMINDANVNTDAK